MFQSIGLYTRGPFQTVDREVAKSRMGEEKAGLDLKLKKKKPKVGRDSVQISTGLPW